MGDYKGRTKLSPPAVYPLNQGASSYPKVLMYPNTMSVYKEITHIPLRL
jgi:hypothetical protein